MLFTAFVNAHKVITLHSSQVIDSFLQMVILRKLALGACDRELELLRSHPKDERGSVREIGLCDRMEPTPHFLELSPTV